MGQNKSEILVDSQEEVSPEKTEYTPAGSEGKVWAEDSEGGILQVWIGARAGAE